MLADFAAAASKVVEERLGGTISLPPLEKTHSAWVQRRMRSLDPGHRGDAAATSAVAVGGDGKLRRLPSHLSVTSDEGSGHAGAAPSGGGGVHAFTAADVIPEGATAASHPVVVHYAGSPSLAPMGARKPSNLATIVGLLRKSAAGSAAGAAPAPSTTGAAAASVPPTAPSGSGEALPSHAYSVALSTLNARLGGGTESMIPDLVRLQADLPAVQYAMATFAPLRDGGLGLDLFLLAAIAPDALAALRKKAARPTWAVDGTTGAAGGGAAGGVADSSGMLGGGSGRVRRGNSMVSVAGSDLAPPATLAASSSTPAPAAPAAALRPMPPPRRAGAPNEPSPAPAGSRAAVDATAPLLLPAAGVTSPVRHRTLRPAVSDASPALSTLASPPSASPLMSSPPQRRMFSLQSLRDTSAVDVTPLMPPRTRMPLLAVDVRSAGDGVNKAPQRPRAAPATPSPPPPPQLAASRSSDVRSVTSRSARTFRSAVGDGGPPVDAHLEYHLRTPDPEPYLPYTSRVEQRPPVRWPTLSQIRRRNDDELNARVARRTLQMEAPSVSPHPPT